VVNIDIQDNHEEAVIGAFMICDLCALVGVLARSTQLRSVVCTNDNITLVSVTKLHNNCLNNVDAAD